MISAALYGSVGVVLAFYEGGVSLDRSINVHIHINIYIYIYIYI